MDCGLLGITDYLDETSLIQGFSTLKLSQNEFDQCVSEALENGLPSRLSYLNKDVIQKLSDDELLSVIENCKCDLNWMEIITELIISDRRRVIRDIYPFTCYNITIPTSVVYHKKGRDCIEWLFNEGIIDEINFFPTSAFTQKDLNDWLVSTFGSGPQPRVFVTREPDQPFDVSLNRHLLTTPFTESFRMSVATQREYAELEKTVASLRASLPAAIPQNHVKKNIKFDDAESSLRNHTGGFVTLASIYDLFLAPHVSSLETALTEFASLSLANANVHSHSPVFLDSISATYGHYVREEAEKSLSEAAEQVETQMAAQAANADAAQDDPLGAALAAKGKEVLGRLYATFAVIKAVVETLPAELVKQNLMVVMDSASNSEGKFMSLPVSGGLDRGSKASFSVEKDILDFLTFKTELAERNYTTKVVSIQSGGASPLLHDLRTPPSVRSPVSPWAALQDDSSITSKLDYLRPYTSSNLLLALYDKLAAALVPSTPSTSTPAVIKFGALIEATSTYSLGTYPQAISILSRRLTCLHHVAESPALVDALVAGLPQTDLPPSQFPQSPVVVMNVSAACLPKWISACDLQWIANRFNPVASPWLSQGDMNMQSETTFSANSPAFAPFLNIFTPDFLTGFQTSNLNNPHAAAWLIWMHDLTACRTTSPHAWPDLPPAILSGEVHPHDATHSEWKSSLVQGVRLSRAGADKHTPFSAVSSATNVPSTTTLRLCPGSASRIKWGLGAYQGHALDVLDWALLRYDPQCSVAVQGPFGPDPVAKGFIDAHFGGWAGMRIMLSSLITHGLDGVGFAVGGFAPPVPTANGDITADETANTLLVRVQDVETEAELAVRKSKFAVSGRVRDAELFEKTTTLRASRSPRTFEMGTDGGMETNAGWVAAEDLVKPSAPTATSDGTTLSPTTIEVVMPRFPEPPSSKADGTPVLDVRSVFGHWVRVSRACGLMSMSHLQSDTPLWTAIPRQHAFLFKFVGDMFNFDTVMRTKFGPMSDVSTPVLREAWGACALKNAAKAKRSKKDGSPTTEGSVVDAEYDLKDGWARGGGGYSLAAREWELQAAISAVGEVLVRKVIRAQLLEQWRSRIVPEDVKSRVVLKWIVEDLQVALDGEASHGAGFVPGWVVDSTGADHDPRRVMGVGSVAKTFFPKLRKALGKCWVSNWQKGYLAGAEEEVRARLSAWV